MQGILWLWKHRHCWEQLKYLYEQRIELKRILRNIGLHDDRPSEYQAAINDIDVIPDILAKLREFDMIPLARAWKVSPPLPGSNGRIEKAMTFPTTDKPNPYLRRLDPRLEKPKTRGVDDVNAED